MCRNIKKYFYNCQNNANLVCVYERNSIKWKIIPK